jgi:uncharacterized cupin superfamily protein
MPSKLSAKDIAGAIFKHKDAQKYKVEGRGVIDFTSLVSNDKKFATGMYKAGASQENFLDEVYGVDEFMYFITGSVTLTSEDGTVQVINAGEAVSIPADWKGTWNTEGYTKIWVIYSKDGSALE